MPILEGNSGQDENDLGNLTLDKNGEVGQRPILEREACLPGGEPMQLPIDTVGTRRAEGPLTDEEKRALLLLRHVVARPTASVGQPSDPRMLEVEVGKTGVSLAEFERRVIDECAARARTAARTE